ncbi:hypothetical protein [Nostoc flagelliforme]|nr:hypothetical protein [Nostoc flagelliforme]
MTFLNPIVAEPIKAYMLSFRDFNQVRGFNIGISIQFDANMQLERRRMDWVSFLVANDWWRRWFSHYPCHVLGMEYWALPQLPDFADHAVILHQASAVRLFMMLALIANRSQVVVGQGKRI